MSINPLATLEDQPPVAGGAANSFPRLLLWGGVALSISCILIYFLQVNWARSLFTPWYLPVGGTIGALLVVRTLGWSRSWWRVGIALALVALACLEWVFLLSLTVLPGYTGPIASGSRIPSFHANLADGTPITDAYFRDHPMTAVVFFQGRWCPFCMTQLKELEAHHVEFEQLGTEVVVVSLEDVETASQTKRDFPHLTVVSDKQREWSSAIDLINKAAAPDNSDIAAPTILLVGRDGTVRWLHRPSRIITRPAASELIATIKGLQAP